MARWIIKLAPNKQTFEFICTLASIVGLFLLAFTKDVDINASLPVVLGTYLGARAIEKSTAFVSASKDPKADTRGIINDLENGPQRRADPPE